MSRRAAAAPSASARTHAETEELRNRSCNVQLPARVPDWARQARALRGRVSVGFAWLGLAWLALQDLSDSTLPR